jgi:hypothetical protein
MSTRRSFPPKRGGCSRCCIRRYRAQSGPLPFSAEFVTEFEVEPHPQGAVLRVSQRGFPAGSEADEFFAACEKGWRDTFAGIRAWLANGSGMDADP